MSEFNPHSPLLIHRMPESRRQRLSRVRTLALIVIGAIAAFGVALQSRAHHPAETRLAAAHEPFSYFPG